MGTIGCTAVRIDWANYTNLADSGGIPIKNWYLRYKLWSKTLTQGTDLTPNTAAGAYLANNFTFTFSSYTLTKGELYDFYLIAINDAGQGPVSSLLTI